MKVIYTSWHSPSHICLYEIEHQYLFFETLIYAGCLDIFYPITDPQLFRQSIKRVKLLQIQKIFLTHYQLDFPVTL